MTTLNILYHGLSCFEIEAKSAGGTMTIVADPYNTKGVGLRLPRTLSANILTISRDNDLHNNTEAVSKPDFVITEPGEYEKGGVFVYGIPSKADGEKKDPTSHEASHSAEASRDKSKGGGKPSVICRYEFDDIVVAHLGDLTHSLTDEEFSALENVDILLLPVGGAPTSREASRGEESLDYKRAAEIANQIEPRIIIPMHYAMPGLTVKLDPVEKFLKEYGVKSETVNKLKIAKKDLPEEDTKVMILEKA